MPFVGLNAHGGQVHDAKSRAELWARQEIMRMKLSMAHNLLASLWKCVGVDLASRVRSRVLFSKEVIKSCRAVWIGSILA